MNQPKQIEIQPGQVQNAAAAGVKLLTDDDRVNVPPSMATDGTFSILIGLLNALASGQAVMGNPSAVEAPGAQIQAPPANGEGEPAQE